MEIYIENSTHIELNGFYDAVRAAIAETLRFEGVLFNCEISVTFITKDEIKVLNLKSRGIDSVTDVLSFPLLDGKKDIPALNEKNAEYIVALGDIVICSARAMEQAEDYGHSIQREIGFLTVHSMLHLLGYDHINERDEKEMFDKQEEILSNIGLLR